MPLSTPPSLLQQRHPHRQEGQQRAFSKDIAAAIIALFSLFLSHSFCFPAPVRTQQTPLSERAREGVDCLPFPIVNY